MSQVNKERVQKWVDALRSGEFTQAMGHLKPDKGYCCLGVACELYKHETGEGEWKINHDCMYSEFRIDIQTISANFMPRPVADWYGLEPDPGSGLDTGHTLSYENDSGATFEQIATLIEQEYLNK